MSSVILKCKRKSGFLRKENALDLGTGAAIQQNP